MFFYLVILFSCLFSHLFSYLFSYLFGYSFIHLFLYSFIYFHLFTFAYSAGDVLSALSRNAMAMAQQSRAANQQVQGLSQPARTPLSLVPVPYRNSKLTHLLKGKKCNTSLSRCIVCTVSNCLL